MFVAKGRRVGVQRWQERGRTAGGASAVLVVSVPGHRDGHRGGATRELLQDAHQQVRRGGQHHLLLSGARARLQLHLPVRTARASS